MNGSVEQVKCQVVGVRESGERVIISHHSSHEAAERVMGLIQNKSHFKELRIETDQHAEPPPS
jgi:hypothetical protein